MLLQVDKLSIAFGGVLALQGVTLEVEAGQRVGLIGPNGAGKTTVLNCITRIYNPDSGSIRFAGEEVQHWRPHEIAGRGIARTFQHAQLFRHLTTLDNLLVGQHSAYRGTFLESALRLPRARREERQTRARAKEVLSYLGVSEIWDRTVGDLPFGLQKVVDLGRALVSRPKLVLLDEPVSGLNQEEKAMVAEIIRRLASEMGIAVLLVEHDMSTVMGICQKIFVLNFGQLLAQGTPQAIGQDPSVIEAYLGEAANA